MGASLSFSPSANGASGPDASHDPMGRPNPRLRRPAMFSRCRSFIARASSSLPLLCALATQRVATEKKAGSTNGTLNSTECRIEKASASGSSIRSR